MTQLSVWGVPLPGEVMPGDDLAIRIATAEPGLRDGDVLVVTSKVVSKAEGRVVAAPDREAAITMEAVRVVASRGATRIVQTRHGFVLAAAGVDASNTPAGTVLLLPEDPDASARRIRDGLAEQLGVTVAVVVSDTAGRPWRNGLVDVAIGAAGIAPLRDYRGLTDSAGRQLELTEMADIDAIAAAAELVKGKLAGVPVAVLRGFDYRPSDAWATALVRRPEEDMFRLGSREAHREGWQAAFAAAASALAGRATAGAAGGGEDFARAAAEVLADFATPGALLRLADGVIEVCGEQPTRVALTAGAVLVSLAGRGVGVLLDDSDPSRLRLRPSP